VGGEEAVLDHEAAVGDAEEEGLRPVPGGVETDGPPESAGAPEAEAEDHAGEAGGEQANGRLAVVIAVAEAEEEGETDGGGPETEDFAVTGLEEPEIEAGETASKGVKEEAAGEVLLEETDTEEAQEPDSAIEEDIGAKE